MLVTEQEISEIKKFILQLNVNEKNVVVVEGKRDSAALKKIGYSGKVLEFHKFGGMIKFVDSVAKYEKIIILFDGDKKGRHLTGKTIQLLERRTKIDLSYKRKLREISRGKIKFIEQLVCYEPLFLGLRPDTFLVKGLKNSLYSQNHSSLSHVNFVLL